MKYGMNTHQKAVYTHIFYFFHFAYECNQTQT